MNPCEFLTNLATNSMAVNVVIGGLWSFAVEQWPWFSKLGHKTKRIVVLALCMAVPLLSLCVAVGFYHCSNMLLSRYTLTYALSSGAVSFMSSQMVQLRQS